MRLYHACRLIVLSVVLSSAVVGCSLLVDWPSNVIAVGWSGHSQPIVVEVVPTGYQLVFREGWFEGRPTGSRLIVSRPGGSKRTFDWPPELKDHSAAIHVLDETSLLFVEQYFIGTGGRELRVLGRVYDLAKNHLSAGVAVTLPATSGVGDGTFSRDLRYFALATTTGIWLYDTKAKAAKVLCPDLRTMNPRFSDDALKVAANVAVRDIHLADTPFRDVFALSKGTVTIVTGAWPSRQVARDIFNSACVVIDISTGKIEQALPSPGSVPLRFFDDESYAHRVGRYSATWPFYFDHGGVLHLNEGYMAGPSLSPDGNALGFLPTKNGAHLIAWRRLTDNATVYFDIATGQLLFK